MTVPRWGWFSRVAFVPVLIKEMLGRSLRPSAGPVAIAVLAGLWGAGAAGQVAPDEAWRTITTEHFRVTFPDRLETLGRRTASRAEDAYVALTDAFLPPPSGLIDIVVTDHVDISNGFASVTPSNRITVYARPPVDDVGLGYTDEWLDLVVIHELAHVFHLDRTGTVGRVSRTLFGRSPNQWPFFPGLAQPRWVIEGLATWYESSLTGAGRVRGTYQEMVMRTAAIEGRFESLDRASGESPVWPGGNRPYVYGSMFFDYLLGKHGEDRMAAFAEAAAGQWIPYRLNAAGVDAFGVSISDEWGAWTAESGRRYESAAAALAGVRPVSDGEPVTRGARWGLYPKVSPDGSKLAFAFADGRSDPQVRTSALDGSAARQWARTSSLPSFDWLPDGSIVFSHLEAHGPYRSFSDLVVVQPDGARRRVTEGARVAQPSAGPDGSWVIAVQEGGGTNGLVRVNLESGEVAPVVEPVADVHWARPSVSPDGRWIAASRWTPGAYLDVVILDIEGGHVVDVTRDRAMDLAPAWAPGGATLLWSSDRTGILNVVAADVDPDRRAVGPVRMVTNTATGAHHPSVSPDRAWLYVSAYHADGWEVERLPFQPEEWTDAPAVSPRFVAGDTVPGDRQEWQGDVGGYSPMPTLLPRYWEPLYRDPITTAPYESAELSLRSRQLLGPAIGALTSGEDLVGRHWYEAYARVFTDGGGKVDGGFSYSWAGLGVPVLGLDFQQRWDDGGVRLGQRDETSPLDTLFVLERVRAASSAVTVRRRTWRSSMSLSLSGGLRWETRQLLDNDLAPSSAYRLTRPNSRLSDFGVSFAYGTSRAPAFQLGASRGFSFWLSGRARRHMALPDSLGGRPGHDRSVDEVLSRVSAYASVGGPGYAPHVVALRLAGGRAEGPGADAGYFRTGGASGAGERITGMDLFGGYSILFPVRGYPASTRSGRMAWSAALEYRVPLAMLQRGLGSWPLYLGRVSGTLFADAGNAWGPELAVAGFQSPRRSALASVGGEVTVEVLALWNIDSLFRVGLAVPLVEAYGPVVYLRLGMPF